MVALVCATHCTKEPCPCQPQTPTPTPNPHATKEVTIRWAWENNPTPGWAPPMDTVRYYVNQDSVKKVFIHLVGNYGIGFPVNCSGDYASSLHIARDSLQLRIDIDENKVMLAGSIQVRNDNLPNHDMGQEPGIAWYDRDWFIAHGCNVVVPNKVR